MKVNFAIVLAIVVAMPSLIGLAPAAAGDVKEKAVKELLVFKRVGVLHRASGWTNREARNDRQVRRPIRGWRPAQKNGRQDRRSLWTS